MGNRKVRYSDFRASFFSIS